jgi:AcrR family transcriptional regulator
VGVDRIVEEARVSKRTLYRHAPSKEELVLEALALREERWTEQWLCGEIERRGGTPAERLLSIFAAFDDWFSRDDYESCFFVNTLLETRDRTSRVGTACVAGLRGVRLVVRDLARDAGIADPDDFAATWQILMTGSIVAAARGDRDAARRAADAGRIVLDHALAGR